MNFDKINCNVSKKLAVDAINLAHTLLAQV